MRQNFKGWTTVFGFTFRQNTKSMGFRMVTAMVSFLIIGIIIVISIITAKPDKEEIVEVSPVKTVFILDNSGLEPTDFKNLNPEFALPGYQGIALTQVSNQTREEMINAAAKDSDQSISVIISANDIGYEIEALVPSNSTITSNQALEVASLMSTAFETSKLLQSGLDEEQLKAVLIPEVTSYSYIGEESNIIVKAIKIIAPMIFSFLLYFMLLSYGQTVSKSVSNEKTSKLMETLLTSIHPYALITGKILAVTTIALGQFTLWIISIFVGLYGGNAIAGELYPNHQNTVITVINFLRDNIGESAMSPSAIILALIFFCVGFLFYCVLAGLAGSLVSKPEDVASTQSLFIFPIIISWVVVYFGSLAGNDRLVAVTRFIPFTAPFSVPVDLMTGTINPLMGILFLAILLIFTLLTIILSGKLYKGLILYHGQNMSVKMLGNILRAKNN